MGTCSCGTSYTLPLHFFTYGLKVCRHFSVALQWGCQVQTTLNCHCNQTKFV